jgi:hypothetical protein
MSLQLNLTDATFLTSGVRVGDQVLLANAPSNMMVGAYPDPNTFPGKFLVISVEDETHLTYDGFLNGTALGLTLNSGATGTVGYKVVHNLSKDEQIDAALAYAASVADKRVTLVWPPLSIIKNDDGTMTEVDGTFLASCLASAKSANPAQQGFTNFPFPGPYQLKYSNTYFNKSQLTRLAEGGYFVLVQDAPGANIYALHQKTTATDTFTNSELSCVTAEDKVSADLIALFKPYVGPYNISTDYLSFLHSIGDQYMYKAKSEKSPKCGALILNGNIDLIRAQINGQNLDVPQGTVEITASVEIGKPANWIQIKLLVS